MARTRFALPLLIFTVLTACSPVEGEVQKEGAAPGEVIEIQAADLAGDWLGGFALNPEKETTETYLQLSFSIADDGESFSGAVIQAWQLELRPTALTDIILSENTFSFSLDNFSFSGTLIVDEIHGELTDGQQSGEFTLMRHQPLSQAQSDALIGSYSFPTGELIDILRSPGWIGYNAELLLFNHQTGDLRALLPMSPLRFAIGPGAGAAYPVDSFLNFDAEGNLLTIEFGSAELINGAEKMVLRKQEIRFPSAQDAELAGTLFLPEGDGPFPAIVMTHGSGRTTRDIYWYQVNASYFSQQGVAVLIYDKRGVAESGGTYRDSASASNFELLASDALAGVQALAAMHQIDPNRIGLLGISQAGWINPLAASLSDEIAFYINISGPAVSVGEEGRFSSFTNNGNSDSLTDIASYNESMLSVSPSGFNPLPILADLHSPALWIFGRDDLSVPTAKSVLNLEKLRAAGHDNITVVVYADTGHSLRINPGGLVRGNFDSPGFVSGYFPQQLAWLVEQGFLTSN